MIVREVGPSQRLGIQGRCQIQPENLRQREGDASTTTGAAPDGSSSRGNEATGLPPTNDFESALVQTLGPGNYTTIVRGTSNTTGVAIVEAYTLQ